MIIICKHGNSVKVVIDWIDQWHEEGFVTDTPVSSAELGKVRPKLDPKLQFLLLTGCPHCRWIEMEEYR